MVRKFKDDLKYINVFVILFKETDKRLDTVGSMEIMLHPEKDEARKSFFHDKIILQNSYCVVTNVSKEV